MVSAERCDQLYAESREAGGESVGEALDMLGDGGLSEIKKQAERSGQANGPGIVRGPAGFEAASLLDILIGAHRSDLRCLEVVSPPALGRRDAQVAGQWAAKLGHPLLTEVEKPGAEGSVEPLMSAASENIDGSFAHANGHCAELLNGVDDQIERAIAA